VSQNEPRTGECDTRPPITGRVSHSPGYASLVAWAGAAAIAASAAFMIVVSAGGPNLSVPAVHGAGHPPWWHPLHLSAALTAGGMWLAMAVGCAGVIAGLMSVARGARLPLWLLPGLGVVAVVILTVLPPAGSTDALSYAVNGRMAVLGHSPYVLTPAQLGALGDPVGRAALGAIPGLWKNTVSVYGPVATAAEWMAARLGGMSLAHITFWLKLIQAVCFLAAALVLDRMLRHDPAKRLRAHLLWTANPLLLWEIVASGHIDVLAAVFGLLAIAVLRRDSGIWAAVGSGTLVALAAGVKVEYALLGLAVAWACRRSVRLLLAALAGFAVVTLPSYLIAGTPAVKALFIRSGGVTSDTMYQLFWRPVLGYTHFSANQSTPPGLELVAYLLFGAIAILAVLRLPDRGLPDRGLPDRGFADRELPALAPALGLSLAFLFVTAFQRPWYDVQAVSLLALYSASLLDYVVLVRLLAAASVYVIAVAKPSGPHWLVSMLTFNESWLTPAVLLVSAAALVWLCISGRWGWRSGYPQEPPVDTPQGEAAGSTLPLAT